MGEQTQIGAFTSDEANEANKADNCNNDNSVNIEEVEDVEIEDEQGKNKILRAKDVYEYKEDYPWKTNDMGSPDDRNYRYEIPVDNSKGMMLVSLIDKNQYATHRSLHIEKQDLNVVIKTIDNKGPVKGLGEFNRSDAWRTMPDSKCEMIDEYNRSRSGSGSKIKGKVRVNPEVYGVHHIEFEDSVSFTPVELDEFKESGANYEELMDELRSMKKRITREYRENNELPKQMI